MRRRCTFQMAEAAIPRSLLVEILRLIDGLLSPIRHVAGLALKNEVN